MLKISRYISFIMILCMFGLNSAALAKNKSQKKNQSKSHKKLHKVHTINKKHLTTATRKVKKSGYSAIGIASFYGSGFHGRTMANGETFNSHNINTAAHKFLPLGTKLKVTNLSNGRTIYVEVCDRMGHSSRVIDLSQAAAKKIGMHQKGLTRVEIVKISNAEFYEKKHYLEVNDGDNGYPH